MASAPDAVYRSGSRFSLENHSHPAVNTGIIAQLSQLEGCGSARMESVLLEVLLGYIEDDLSCF